MAPCGHTLSPAKSPPGTECFDIFSPPPGDSEVISQLERLNSNETKIAPRSVWTAVNGSDLSAPTFMVSLETLNLVGDQLGLTNSGGFWGAVGSLNDNFGVLGYLIVGIFIVAWLVSYVVYRFNRYDEIEASAG
jgi:hypothetical protein